MSSKKLVLTLLVAAILLPVVPAFAELQNVTIGGEVYVRGRYWRNFYGTGNRWANRVPENLLPGRPMGDIGRGDLGIWSRTDFSDEGADRKYVEQRAVLKVSADFTDDVKGVMTIEAHDVWGEDFRSNYITGADGVTPTDDDLEFIEAYIQTSNMFGTDFDLRIGRQLLSFGKEWLVGKKFSGTRAQPFDAIRLTYDLDSYEVDAFWAKLAENSPREEDGDVDFYGVYATYKEMEALQVSGYYFLLRDARALPTFDGGIVWEALEDVVGVDNYDPTYLHTVGTRLFGETGGWDYDLELAFQFGEADAIGSRFRPAGLLFGHDDAEFDSWAAQFDLGYTFDMTMSPRVFVNGLWYDGEDNRDLNFWQWVSTIANPFHEPESSVSFNRLFSNDSIESMLDSGDQIFTNLWRLRAGIELKPTEKLSTSLKVSYYGVVDEFDEPRFWIGDNSFLLGPKRPLFPALSFWTQPADDDLGWFAALRVRYHYTEDVYFTFGWDHLFTGDGMAAGNYVMYMGSVSTMGLDDKDADYWYFDTKVKF